MNKTILLIFFAAGFSACHSKEALYDASGTFEAIETIVSSEASGTIRQLNIEEGQVLGAGDVVGYIDSVQLHLRKRQLQAQSKAVVSRKPDMAAQTAALQEQLRHAESEQARTSNLVQADAATPRQLDDINAQIAVLKKQIAAQRSTLKINSSSLDEETAPVQIQVQQINDQIEKCRIVNPVNGTVLVKYAQANEVAATGKPIYKIADLKSIILRAYISGNQIASVKTGQQVKVLVEGRDTSYPGTIEWISSKAEFTPKTIQTRDERANLVYAMKVKVNNDGYLKIGMYGEVSF